MVDSEAKAGTGFFLNKLYNCHQKARSIFSSSPGLTTIQFSDSIVLSLPYSKERFEDFVDIISRYQSYLLEEGLLCRGGIAVNQHFNDDSFTFSAGLIDAYHVESTSAKYPRIVISSDVIDLVYPNGRPLRKVIREDDGLYFVDYLSQYKDSPEGILRIVSGIVEDIASSNSASVREKGIWLACYCDAILGSQLCPPRFAVPST